MSSPLFSLSLHVWNWEAKPLVRQAQVQIKPRMQSKYLSLSLSQSCCLATWMKFSYTIMGFVIIGLVIFVIPLICCMLKLMGSIFEFTLFPPIHFRSAYTIRFTMRCETQRWKMERFYLILDTETQEQFVVEDQDEDFVSNERPTTSCNQRRFKTHFKFHNTHKHRRGEIESFIICKTHTSSSFNEVVLHF